MTTSATATVDADEHGQAGHECPQCLLAPPKTGSAKVAWAVALVAVALLLVVLFLGVGSSGGNALAFLSIPLLAVLVCPLTMGGMMWFMMRKR